MRQVGRQGPPGAPLADSVPDGVHDRPAGVFRWPAARLVGRDQRLQDRPLRVGQAGREHSRSRHPCRFHAREGSLDRSTDSRLLSQQALRPSGVLSVNRPVQLLAHGCWCGKPRDAAADRYLDQSSIRRPGIRLKSRTFAVTTVASYWSATAAFILPHGAPSQTRPEGRAYTAGAESPVNGAENRSRVGRPPLAGWTGPCLLFCLFLFLP